MENNVLPSEFNGVFYFTNFTDRDFKAKWNSVEYTFPAMKSTPMIISGASPEDVQVIRKKFARELATEVWYSTDKFKYMDSPDRGQRPATYTDSDLAPFIQKCLEPLPIGQVKAEALPKDKTENYRSTKVLDKDESLLKGAGETVM
jgi:hypothetical protein